MDDVLKQIKTLFENLGPLWEKISGEAKLAWDRDKARAMRLQQAWKNYDKPVE